MKRISLAEKHSVPLSYIIPALEDPQSPDVVDLSGEMVARIGVARERHMRESSKMFASEPWLKRVAHDIMKTVWYGEEPLLELAPAPVRVEPTLFENFWYFSSWVFISHCHGICVEYLRLDTFARLRYGPYGSCRRTDHSCTIELSPCGPLSSI